MGQGAREATLLTLRYPLITFKAALLITNWLKEENDLHVIQKTEMDYRNSENSIPHIRIIPP